MKWKDISIGQLLILNFLLLIILLVQRDVIELTKTISLDGAAQILLAGVAVLLVYKYEYSTPSVESELSFFRSGAYVYPLIKLTLLNHVSLTEGDVRFEMYSNERTYDLGGNIWTLVTGERERQALGGYHKYISTDLVFPERFKISGKRNSVLLRLPSIDLGRKRKDNNVDDSDVRLQIFIGGREHGHQLNIAKDIERAELSGVY